MNGYLPKKPPPPLEVLDIGTVDDGGSFMDNDVLDMLADG
jgi:hypothetical protein